MFGPAFSARWKRAGGGPLWLDLWDNLNQAKSGTKNPALFVLGKEFSDFCSVCAICRQKMVGYDYNM